jgi:hypothetical protein
MTLQHTEATTIDDLCTWKEIEKDPESTTFQDVRDNPDHKLYKCILCDGYDRACEWYVHVKPKGEYDNGIRK